VNRAKLEVLSAVTCLGVLCVQPANQPVEALFHFGYTEVFGLEVSVPGFEEELEKAEQVIVKAETDPEFRQTNKGDIIAAQAMTWKGVNFKSGISARCADFVREVLAREGLTDADVPVAKGSLGRLMADSFYNEEAGTIIKDPKYLRAGDIVMMHETYNGGGRILPGAKGNRRITHVGIVVTSDCSVGECMMIDRSTMSRPVNYRSIHTEFRRGYGSHFHSALRPYAYSQPSSNP
jgi:hypothetical protein